VDPCWLLRSRVATLALSSASSVRTCCAAVKHARSAANTAALLQQVPDKQNCLSSTPAFKDRQDPGESAAQQIQDMDVCWLLHSRQPYVLQQHKETHTRHINSQVIYNRITLGTTSGLELRSYTALSSWVIRQHCCYTWLHSCSRLGCCTAGSSLAHQGPKDDPARQYPSEALKPDTTKLKT
jgi:hypothetical protein